MSSKSKSPAAFTPITGGMASKSSSRAEELLRAIIQGTAATTGTQFFRSLVKHLAEGLQVRFAFVAECLPNRRARSLAFFQDQAFGKDFEYALPGTPCMKVAEGRVCHVPDQLAKEFPEDKGMIKLGTVSYLGVPLRGSDGKVIGHLVTFDDKPMPADPLALSVMETFAARAAVELERERAFEDLKRRKEESDERLRDLFDEAPIAYVNEGLDSKFIRANKTALKTLGITEADVPHTYGRSFIPDTPEAQARLKAAFESVNKGVDTSGVVLELRRKDNGKPLWIQWWSRPDPSGQYTRTMFVDITDRVLMEREKARLEAANNYLQEEIRSEHNFGEIVGNDPKLRETLKMVEQVAPADSTVLILGETGTGKELIARAIHDRSPRRQRPLVKVNCGAISAGLVESELFGHVKGAFTGAIANRDGRFKLADGGTIFLDEVGELPLDTQVKLLRVLQEQEFEPIGSSRTIKVDVRVVAATNRDLQELVREGRFRADLYYRLNVVPLRVPPLRERASDIHLLTMFFVQRFAKKLGRAITHVDDDTMRRLVSYPWPGNIRELQNVIERAVILSPGKSLVLAEELRAAALPGSSRREEAHSEIRNPKSEIRNEESLVTSAATTKENGSLEEVERRHIETVLKQTNWIIEGERGAAKILNLNPSTLRSRMQKLGIRRPGKDF
ncbi:MAG TPA: sigma 54-interacting transcriptional regulator [Verrucomicrobiae bacterium]|nr:sigma 54-interacting transcriptional regulator [Verrucomicrobiae bacterium]